MNRLPHDSKSVQQHILVSISEASSMLGVSEATLRQWTDEGKVRAFITPGGHRRYDRAELRGFMGKQHRIHGLKDLVTSIESTPPLHRQVAHTHFSTASWYNRLDTQTQKHLGESGRELLQLVIKYLTEPAKRRETEERVRSIGSEFGNQAAMLGLSLTETIETFMLHRNPVINAATDLMKRREALNERAVEAIPLLNHVLDETLIAMVAAYQQHREKRAETT
ncbi:MAG: helix-turn-helix domain-containing protein [Chloroflexi bacterium]|nr:helix-turn-helix domain-containing protein [Chloroflexota bacterium]